jgi:hypothetical protein
MISLAVYSKTCISDASNVAVYCKLLRLIILEAAPARSVLSDFGQCQGQYTTVVGTLRGSRGFSKFRRQSLKIKVL